MIARQEIVDLSREFGLEPNVVEKDYALGWLLAGISNHAALRSAWVFKGGTCLKKCYFETYRFSEDLDFTLTDAAHLTQEFLSATFAEITGWVYDQTGIEIPAGTVRFEIYQNPRGRLSAEGRVGYRGPLQRRGDPPRVKLDLTDDEVLVLDPVTREVHHPYSDRLPEGIQAQCYSYEEVFAEKLRALAERERPRDLYDVIHLYRHTGIRPNHALLMRTLLQKCAFKGIAVPTMASLEYKPERVELETEWSNMLGHQLPELPPFEQFWHELPELFDWLQGAPEKALPARMPVAADVDSTWVPPPMVHAWHAAVPLEVIRFAAANRLCVELGYQGKRRLIEPYSLRRTKDGNLLLHATKHETGEPRSYRVDRIESATATRTAFVPRYAIELTPMGPLVAPPSSKLQS
ncbi:MAG: nucleotidyl transferase AbiEii/AbiGii toxin family protein [Gammaproteobacteria bacterium]|nr:nucleotidyl transferase AbiEii/AbiGii toxin family protein [Gammaproteobacteria bacterium]